MPEYRCEILADSRNMYSGDRLTTFEITFPRMVLADMTRHRVLSYSFESTRAVPVEIRIQHVREDPFVPVMRERVRGMATGKPLTGLAKLAAEAAWRRAARRASDEAENLLDVEKGIAGRLLEPFSMITGIVSGTEWRNYTALRVRGGAQFELQVIANMQEKAAFAHEPAPLLVGEWHLPLIQQQEIDRYGADSCARASAGRCASISYMKHSADEDFDKSRRRWSETLLPSAHWSPSEHPAIATSEEDGLGNYTGFKQLRKFYSGEAVAA